MDQEEERNFIDRINSKYLHIMNTIKHKGLTPSVIKSIHDLMTITVHIPEIYEPGFEDFKEEYLCDLSILLDLLKQAPFSKESRCVIECLEMMIASIKQNMKENIKEGLSRNSKVYLKEKASPIPWDVEMHDMNQGLYRVIENNYIVRHALPNTIVCVGYLDPKTNEVIPLTARQKCDASDMGLIIID